MNERIKKLAFQAKLRAAILLHHYGNVDALTDSEQESLKQIEKFAELIVRECIECTKEWRDAVNAESINDYSLGYVHGCDDAIVEIKTRFGVEE